MIYDKRYSWYILLLITVMVLPVSAVAQQTCIFFSKAAPDTQDLVLIAEVEKNYEVVVHDILDLKNDLIDIDYVKMYDFAFVSESVSSDDCGNLKGAPVPIFTTELYISKWNIMGWVPFNQDAYYGNTKEGETAVTIVYGEHDLAAGLETGSEFDLVTGSTSGDFLTFAVPEIDYIQIAFLSADPSKTIVMGIEEGTVLFNAENVKDGSVVTENRIAAVGIDSDSYLFMTPEAFQLIHAGIQWVLKLDDTGVKEENSNLKANEFRLDQNYPNPFNPVTNIRFSLERPGYTTLTVYNVMGHLIAILIDGNITVGEHCISFNVKDLPSGVYYYQIQSGEFCQLRKMLLMR